MGRGRWHLRLAYLRVKLDNGSGTKEEQQTASATLLCPSVRSKKRGATSSGGGDSLCKSYVGGRYFRPGSYLERKVRQHGVDADYIGGGGRV